MNIMDLSGKIKFITHPRKLDRIKHGYLMKFLIMRRTIYLKSWKYRTKRKQQKKLSKILSYIHILSFRFCRYSSLALKNRRWLQWVYWELKNAMSILISFSFVRRSFSKSSQSIFFLQGFYLILLHSQGLKPLRFSQYTRFEPVSHASVEKFRSWWIILVEFLIISSLKPEPRS